MGLQRVRHNWAAELNWQFILLFSCQVVSDSSWPHGLQHARLPFPCNLYFLHHWKNWWFFFVEVCCYELEEKMKKIADIFTCNILQGPRKTSLHNMHIWTCAHVCKHIHRRWWNQPLQSPRHRVSCPFVIKAIV